MLDKAYMKCLIQACYYVQGHNNIGLSNTHALGLIYAVTFHNSCFIRHLYNRERPFCDNEMHIFAFKLRQTNGYGDWVATRATHDPLLGTVSAMTSM